MKLIIFILFLSILGCNSSDEESAAEKITYSLKDTTNGATACSEYDYLQQNSIFSFTATPESVAAGDRIDFDTTSSAYLKDMKLHHGNLVLGYTVDNEGNVILNTEDNSDCEQSVFQPPQSISVLPSQGMISVSNVTLDPSCTNPTFDVSIFSTPELSHIYDGKHIEFSNGDILDISIPNDETSVSFTLNGGTAVGAVTMTTDIIGSLSLPVGCGALNLEANLMFPSDL